MKPKKFIIHKNQFIKLKVSFKLKCVVKSNPLGNLVKSNLIVIFYCSALVILDYITCYRLW